MPIFMDRHFIEDATQTVIATAHEKDLEIQHKHGVKFLTYWFDEARYTAFCLVDAPNKKAIQIAHDEAHGDVPHEIIEVDPIIVESFLGRVKDPAPVSKASTYEMDSAFRSIMFTDLKDSTQMTSTHGDAKSLHLLHINNVMTRNALRAHNGTEVKHMGDGIMASFSQVDDAVECAISIQKAFHQHNDSNSQEKLYLRIGLSAGEPIEEHGDLFGNAVQLSARLCNYAEPCQILVADIIKHQCDNDRYTLRDAGQIELKGFNQPIQSYEVKWQ